MRLRLAVFGAALGLVWYTLLALVRAAWADWADFRDAWENDRL